VAHFDSSSEQKKFHNIDTSSSVGTSCWKSMLFDLGPTL